MIGMQSYDSEIELVDRGPGCVMLLAGTGVFLPAYASAFCEDLPVHLCSHAAGRPSKL